MQVVSGRIDSPKVHFTAPSRAVLDRELSRFIDWFNASQTDTSLDPLLRAIPLYLEVYGSFCEAKLAVKH